MWNQGRVIDIGVTSIGLDKENPRTIIRVSEFRQEDIPDYLTNSPL